MPQTPATRRTLLRAATALAAGAALPQLTAAPAAAAAPAAFVDPTSPAGVRPRLETAATTGQRLVFSDEFNGTALDPAKWTARDQQRSGGNQGVQWWYKPQNVRLTNGALALDLGSPAPGVYSGARVDSQGKFDLTYGTVEYGIHVPPTEGHLAAAWLQASDGTLPGGAADGSARDGCEIDVLESFSKGDEYGVTLHWDGYGAAHRSSNAVAAAPGLHSGGWYHAFSVTWTPTQLVFGYDGRTVRTVTDPALVSQVREFPIASHEVIAYAQGDVRLAPLDWHSTMYVDYVRIWQ
ncbi:glycoside hydrolase family 16 protein [Streptomyces sp. NPDC089919]|uniref:glycoside hydrolase family 16 protein n=1 Tax=Streptomyces sp. NPDC089919 TaxID=3155188 RepID=UPI00341B4AFE